MMSRYVHRSMISWEAKDSQDWTRNLYAWVLDPAPPLIFHVILGKTLRFYGPQFSCV